MEKRAFTRRQLSVPVRCYCENSLYLGMVTNLSEDGMFIRTSNLLPCSNSVDLLFPIEAEIKKFSALIVRIEKINDNDCNIGIKLIEPPKEYFRFVDDI